MGLGIRELKGSEVVHDGAGVGRVLGAVHGVKVIGDDARGQAEAVLLMPLGDGAQLAVVRLRGADGGGGC